MRNIAHHGHYNSVKLSSHQECIRQKSNAFSTYPDQRKQTVFFFLRKRQLMLKKIVFFGFILKMLNHPARSIM